MATSPVGSLVVQIIGDSGPLKDSIDEMNSHLKDFGDSVNNELSDKISEAFAKIGESVREEVLKMAEVFATFEGLKEFATEALEAYSASERFTTSMAQLTGSAEVAEDTLTSLKAITASQPFALPDLLTSAQRLTAFGIEADKIPTVMQAAANAAAATGNSFDGVAQALGRVAVSGQVSGRQLTQLGVSWGDIAKAMGTSVENAQALMKKGGQDAEKDLAVLIDALNDKFSGASQAFAGTISGQFQILKNNIELMMEGAGEALAPLARTLLSFAESEVLPFFADLGASLRQIAASADPLLTGALQATLAGVRDVLQVISLAAAGAVELAQDFRMVADAGRELADASGLSGFTWMLDKFGAAVKIFHDVIDVGLFGVLQEFKPEMNDVRQGFESGISGPLGYSETVRNTVVPDLTASYKKMEAAAEHFGTTVEETLGKLPQTYQAYLAQLDQGGETAASALKQIESEILKGQTMMENMSGAPLQAMQQWVDILKMTQTQAEKFAATDAFNQLALKVAALADKYPAQMSAMGMSTDIFVAHMKAAAEQVPDALNKMSADKLLGEVLQSQKELDDQTARLGNTFTKTWDAMYKGAQQQVPILGTIGQRLAAIDFVHHQVATSAESVVGEYLKMAAAMNAAGMSTEQQLDDQINKYRNLLQIMQMMNQPLQMQRDLEQQITQLEVNKAVAMGDSEGAVAGQIKLIGMEWTNTGALAVDAVKRTADALANDLSSGISGVISGTESLGDAFAKLGLDVFNIIEETIIKQALGDLIKNLSNIGSFLGNFFGGFLGFLGFSGGGVVPSAAGGMVVGDGGGGVPSILHPKEMVLPADLSEGIQQIIRNGKAANAATATFGNSSSPASLWAGPSQGGNIQISRLEISVNGSRNPRETAREIATYLKGLSRSFSVAG